MGEGAPTIFISYAHSDDGEDYRAKVYSLSERLRQQGIDCEIDQYVENRPPASWPAWMAEQIREARYVLVVCSHTYKRRFEGTEKPGVGLGSRWEGGAITAAIYEEEGRDHKFIPVGFKDYAIARDGVPYPLNATSYYDLSSDGGYVNLLRRIFEEPKVTKSPLGPRPSFATVLPQEENPVQRAVSVIKPLLNRAEHRIALDDAITNAIRSFKKRRNELGFEVGSPPPTVEEYRRRVKGYEEAATPLIGSLIPIAKHSRGEELAYLRNAVESITAWAQPDGTRYTQWDQLWDYATTFLVYCLGSVAVEAENYAALRMLLLEPKSADRFSERPYRILDRIYGAYTLQSDLSKTLDGVRDRARLPASEHLGSAVEEALASVYEHEEAALAFDRFEFFLSLVFFTEREEAFLTGRFHYKLNHAGNIEANPISRRISEGVKAGDRWSALTEGFFGGNVARLQERFDLFAGEIRDFRHFLSR